jgi:Tfp pilus assembly protein PilO
MINSASPHQRMIIGTVLAGAALLAALWLLALSPKRSESAEVRSNVAAQEQRLSAAKAQVATYEAARTAYPQHVKELRHLDKAVPARGAIPALLRQLQQRANARKADLQIAALQPGAAAAPAAPGVAPTAEVTPGATVGAGGIATLPFTFTYTGEYFDLVHILGAARKAVSVHHGNLTIDGRLVTIEGLTFQRTDPDASLITATVAGTAYIASAPTQPTAATAATTTPGGS